jgi:hypothetical protein
MAQQTKRRRSSSNSSESRGRRAVNQRTEGSERNKSPTPQKGKQGSEKTRPEQMYEDYTVIDPGEVSDTDEPDVVLDIPVVKVDEIDFELDDLIARISLHAEVLDLVKLSVGVHAELGKVKLNIKGVEAQALLRARLDHVTAIIDRVLTTLDRNPEVLQNIARALQPVTEGAGKAVGEVGEGTNKAVGEIGEGAGGAVKDVGGGAGKAVGEVGEGAGQAVGGLGEGGGSENGGGTGGGIAKQIAKIVAAEIKAAASDEVKDIGLGAAHKAMEIGEKRRQRRAQKRNATEAALRRAEEGGVDIDDVEGTGAEGRVTVHDVEKAMSA